MRRQPGGRLELAREVVGAEMGRRCHLLQVQTVVEMTLDVLGDGAELPSRERTVRPTVRRMRCEGVPDQVDGEEVGQGLGGEPAPGGAGRQLVDAISDSAFSTDGREPRLRPALRKFDLCKLRVHVEPGWLKRFNVPAVVEGVVQLLPRHAPRPL